MFEFVIIICRFLFMFYCLYFLWQGLIFLLDERSIRKSSQRLAVSKQRVTIVFMHLTAFLILAYIPGTFNFDLTALLVGGAGLLFFICGHFAVDKIYKKSCPLMWNSVFFLLDVGLITLQRLDPALAKKQLGFFFLGFLIMLIIPLVLKFIPKIEKLEKIYLVFAFVLILLPFFFGRRIFGAINWIEISNFTFQPSELVKFLLIFYLASVFRKKLNIVQLSFPAAMTAILILILVFQRDLGGALIFFMTFLVMLYISTGSVLLFSLGIAAASLGSFMAYHLFEHVRTRVLMWQNPWQDPYGDGHQIIQSLFAIGTWGLLGSGLTLGYPNSISVVKSDFIFSAICEEFGSLFGMGVIGVFLMIFYRGVHISLRCKRRYYSLLAAGFTGILAFQTFLILGGVIKLIPLTGVTLPFVSYGGSSILVSIMMIGILQWLCMYYGGVKEE